MQIYSIYMYISWYIVIPLKSAGVDKILVIHCIFHWSKVLFIFQFVDIYIYIYKNWVGELQYVAFSMQHFCSADIVITSPFIIIMIDIMSLGPLHVLRLQFGVSKSMFPVKTFAPTNPLFVSAKFHGNHETVTNIR